MNGRPGFSPAIPPSQICCKSNRGLELPKYHLLVLVPGRQARNLGALCTERQWVASELQVLEEEDEDKNAGVKGFRFWPSPHLKGRTATNQQRVQRWLPQCHCDNWPLFSLPSDQNYPAPKRRRSNKVRPQQRHIISQKPPPTDRTFSGQK